MVAQRSGIELRGLSLHGEQRATVALEIDAVIAQAAF